ncbi:hypothetical protein Fmac_002468 [Flemingia macrophylla]|uniref:Reverse transcriptase Ty1/copia-type domain-containing protein n=1 Tax=Flemingia macrophylla TaxID=520843 RepID=A0ABD1NLP4_9FABA
MPKLLKKHGGIKCPCAPFRISCFFTSYNSRGVPMCPMLDYFLIFCPYLILCWVQMKLSFQNYVVGNYPSYEEIINFSLFANYEPITFEETSSDEKWIKSLDDEIHAIEKNKMWELANFPADKRSIGVKWVHKTKYNPNKENDHCKAKLATTGYK